MFSLYLRVEAQLLCKGMSPSGLRLIPTAGAALMAGRENLFFAHNCWFNSHLFILIAK